MAGQNDFLIFDENKDNILTQELYSVDSDRTDGFKTGLARSNVNNKVLHQTSMMCNAIGEIIKDYGLTASDNGSVETLKQALLTAFSKQGVIESIYPVGSIYMSVNEVNPATSLGFGTWEQIKDCFLLACGDTYKNEAVGGSSTVSLTTEQIPTHTHVASTSSAGDHSHSRGTMEISGGLGTVHQYGYYETGVFYRSWNGTKQGSGSGTGDWSNWEFRASCNWTGSSSSNGTHTHDVTVENAGLGEAHDNMPPYLAVNVWKRIA